MNRRIRLLFIALLEVTWLLLGAGVSFVLIFRGVSSFGMVGLLFSIFLSIGFTAGIGGLVFLLVELHYSLRVIENFLLEDFQELKSLLAKLAKIDYRIYELFYDQFYGGTAGSVGETESGSDAEQVDSLNSRNLRN